MATLFSNKPTWVESYSEVLKRIDRLMVNDIWDVHRFVADSKGSRSAKGSAIAFFYAKATARAKRGFK